jgi:hypothetical protein
LKNGAGNLYIVSTAYHNCENMNVNKISVQTPISRSLTLMLLTIFAGCQPYAIRHDPSAAGAVALSFAQVAFVNQDFEGALNFLPKSRANTLTVDSLRAIVIHTHKDAAFPQSVRLSAYEIIPSQHAINIYLTGLSSKGPYYYQLVLSGDASRGYQVTEMYGSFQEFPSSSLRKSF